jgi:N-acetyl-anhydromuramyl-L-alanine amidase AmpD
MNYLEIAIDEKDFRNTLTDSRGKSYTIVDSQNLNGHEMLSIRPSYNSYYNDETFTKNKIVIHGTQGDLKQDISSLTKKNIKTSAAFVVARDGTIYELFDPQKWAYHTGSGYSFRKDYISERSIAIELSNMGPLELNQNDLYNVVTRKNKSANVYCSEIDTSQYTKLDEPFKGRVHFASYPIEQIDALVELINYISDKYKIPKEILPENERFEKMSARKALDFNGICTDLNFNSDKMDIGPDFPWNTFLDKLFPNTVSEESIMAEPVEVKVVEQSQSSPIKPREEIRINIVNGKINMEEIKEFFYLAPVKKKSFWEKIKSWF